MPELFKPRCLVKAALFQEVIDSILAGNDGDVQRVIAPMNTFWRAQGFNNGFELFVAEQRFFYINDVFFKACVRIHLQRSVDGIFCRCDVPLGNEFHHDVHHFFLQFGIVGRAFPGNRNILAMGKGIYGPRQLDIGIEKAALLYDINLFLQLIERIPYRIKAIQTKTFEQIIPVYAARYLRTALDGFGRFQRQRFVQ